MESQLRFTVDAAHCRRASDELYAILLRQEQAYRDRWYESPRYKMAQKIARVVGLAVSIIGLALSIWLLTLGARWIFAISFILIFSGCSLAFLFGSRLLIGIRSWGDRVSERRCRRRTNKFFKVASKLAPFEANYDVKGDLIIYSRYKDGEWQFAWQRKLSLFRARGVAMQSRHITAIFRRPTSFQPSIIVLHENPDWLASSLQEAGVTSRQ